MNDAEREARDVLERAIDFLWPHYTDSAMPKMDYAAQSPECQRLARALTEYGDLRAWAARKDVLGEKNLLLIKSVQAARAAALEEAAQIADDFTCGACGMDGKAGDAIRALAAAA